MFVMEKIIKYFGSMKKMAAALDCHYQSIQYWDSQGRVPVTRAIQIEKITNGDIKRGDLRPDIFE
jgi:DNA-binding transcriptional regulator YdaS (Cro superfamily)